MPFATFRGETSVADIADRLFVRLTPRQRETAEAALIRANPQLERIRDVRDGAVLNVPDIPALRAKRAPTEEHPDRQVLELLGEAVGAYRQHLAERHEQDVARVKEETSTVRSARFTRGIANVEDVVALAQEARAALDARARAADARQGAIDETLARAAEDIKAAMTRG